MLYEIAGQLATLNEHDNANRSNRFGGGKLKKDQTELVAYQVMGKRKITKPCFVTFHWFHSGKHDYDNIAFAKKYVLDGMIKGGVLPNDNQAWVLGFADDFTKVDKGEERVLVEVEEITEDA